jgi:superfamily II DNA or RNA helicase
LLHSYQRHAVNRILEEPAVGLFLDMGLGKTIIALTAIDELIRRGEVSKVLVIAPKRVAENSWTEEAQKWGLQLKISKVLGSQKQRIKALQTEADIYVINRENVPWLVKHRFDFDMLVIDELSSFKSPSS